MKAELRKTPWNYYEKHRLIPVLVTGENNIPFWLLAAYKYQPLVRGWSSNLLLHSSPQSAITTQSTCDALPILTNGSDINYCTCLPKNYASEGHTYHEKLCSCNWKTYWFIPSFTQNHSQHHTWRRELFIFSWQKLHFLRLLVCDKCTQCANRATVYSLHTLIKTLKLKPCKGGSSLTCILKPALPLLHCL